MEDMKDKKIRIIGILELDNRENEKKKIIK